MQEMSAVLEKDHGIPFWGAMAFFSVVAVLLGLAFALLRASGVWRDSLAHRPRRCLVM